MGAVVAVPSYTWIIANFSTCSRGHMLEGSVPTIRSFYCRMSTYLVTGSGELHVTYTCRAHWGNAMAIFSHPRLENLQAPPGTDAKVASIRFLALLCNALLQTGAPSNRLEEAMRPLISSGRIPPQMDAQNMACYLNLYDLQVSLCELSRWLRGGGSGNRHTSIIVANMVRSNV